VAEIAAERMEELVGTASLRDAGITAGIATDKLLALSSDSFSQANNHLHAAAKALPSGADNEATQSTATPQPAEGSAGEEKLA
jgi:hypothetical protein